MGKVRIELDSTTHTVDIDDGTVLRCSCDYEYAQLMEILLSQSQWDRHMGLSFDGVYYTTDKKIQAGKEYMNQSPFRKKS
jgi:hypothetical protein